MRNGGVVPAGRSFGIAFALIAELSATVAPAGIKSDEEVVFFDTFGYLADEGSTWVLQIHGWIYEPETESQIRNATIAVLRRLLGLERHDLKSAIFERRARPFLVDNERFKRVSIRLGEKIFTSPRSGRNGHFRFAVRLSAMEVDRLIDSRPNGIRRIRFTAVTAPSDRRRFSGSIRLIEESGLSVLSDIDDTIRLSNAHDRKALLANTFLREFVAVPGMAEAYRSLERNGARFHYVSAGPWQLYRPLTDFLRDSGFPEGTFHLQVCRVHNTSSSDFFGPPDVSKRESIRPILRAFPRRQFVLIGDSGEKDPELYGSLVRRHPRRVRMVFIRNVSGESFDSDRLRRAFRGVEPERWRLIDSPSEIKIHAPDSADRPRR